MRRWIFLGLLLLAACGRGVPNEARVVVAGDSVMAWNRTSGGSIADGLEARLNVPVGDVSMPWARFLGGSGGLNIPAQLDRRRVEWVVLNGGANDLRGSCGCTGCDAVLNRLITTDGQRGAIPALVFDLRKRGMQVVWVDYYTSPLYAGTVCERPYRELERRLDRMAASRSGVFLVDADDVFSPDDPTLFAPDRLHPSKKGSVRIVEMVVPLIARAGAGR